MSPPGILLIVIYHAARKNIQLAGKVQTALNLFSSCFSGYSTIALVLKEAVVGVVRKEGLSKTKVHS